MGGAGALLREFGQRPLLSVAGDVYDILVDGNETEQRSAVVMVVVTPGNGPPPHTHHREDESFCVLEGEVTFTLAGRPVPAPAGTVVHVPRGVAHTFRNTGSSPARLLVWLTPAGLERFFRDVGEPLPPGVCQPTPPTEAHVRKLLAKAPEFGVEIHPPAS